METVPETGMETGGSWLYYSYDPFPFLTPFVSAAHIFWYYSFHYQRLAVLVNVLRYI